MKKNHLRKNHILQKIQRTDLYLFSIYIIMIAFSIILVYSTSSKFSAQQTGDPYYLFNRHFIGIIVSFIILILGYTISLKWIKQHTAFISIGIIILLILPLVPGIGVEIGGSKRWLSLFGLQFQPSEIIRMALVFYLSYHLSTYSNDMVTSKWNQKKFILLGFVGISCLFILLQKNFSITFLSFAMAISMFFIAKVPIKILFHIIVLGIIFLIPFVIFSPYRLERIDMLINLNSNPSNSYQIYQALKSFTRGGLLGVGPGDGRYSVPYIFNDFIFAATAEEYGFIGAIILIILFFILLQRGFRIANKLYTEDLYLSYISYGITFSIVFQSIINMAVNMAILFPTGITLPLISYGGTSLIVTSFAIGVLLQLSSQIKQL